MSESGSGGTRGPWIVRYPYAVGILCAALDVRLELRRVPHPELDANELALVRVGIEGALHDVIVDNEYGDADTGHRALLLVLVLQALRDLAEEPDFDAWKRELWIEAPIEQLVELHGALAPAAADLLPIFAKVELPGDYEWSVNSDGAQALRRLAAGDMW